jgi:hypothetical protein
MSTSDGAGDGALVSLDKKLQLVRDRVRGVALGFHHGGFMHGRAGIGKSYLVKSVLDEMVVSGELKVRPVEVADLFRVKRKTVSTKKKSVPSA